MRAVPTIRPEPKTLETFQKTLEESHVDFLTMLANTFSNSAYWLGEIQSLQGDSDDTPQLQLEYLRRDDHEKLAGGMNGGGMASLFQALLASS